MIPKEPLEGPPWSTCFLEAMVGKVVRVRDMALIFSRGGLRGGGKPPPEGILTLRPLHVIALDGEVLQGCYTIRISSPAQRSWQFFLFVFLLGGGYVPSTLLFHYIIGP